MIEFGFTKDSEMKYLDDYVPAIGDKLIAGEEAKTERLLITSTVLLMMSGMHDPLFEEMFHIKETEAGKFAMEMDGHVSKLIWRKWDTNYLEEIVKQVKAIHERNQAL